MKKVMPVEHSFPFKLGTSGIGIFAALLFALACAATALNAGTIAVTSKADTGPDAPLAGTLRAALASAADGDTIDATGITGTITLTTGLTTKAELVVNKSVTILGPGPTNLTVDANHLSRVFNIRPGHSVTIEGLRIVNGEALAPFPVDGGGGGIYNDDSALTVNNCTLSGNSAQFGGGIFNNGSIGGATLTVDHSTLSGNSGNGGGGAIFNYGSFGNGTLTVRHSTLSGNSANQSDGGGIRNRGFSGSSKQR